MSMVSLLEQIERGEIVLPSIQRDFVWPEEKIEKLMDSVMRGYPIGIIFLWETYGDIGYREFVKDYRSDGQGASYESNEGKRFPDRLKLVLDGQQRLQSLYIALYGTYEGRHLYFDVLSGRDTEDFNEDKFIFSFLTPQEADKRNNKAASRSEAHNGDGGEACYFCNVRELAAMGAWDRQKLQQGIKEKFNLSNGDELRLGFNLSALHDALFFDRNMLNTTTIDEYKPRDSRDRKSESEILEIFVRINRQGTPLGKSDLFFSMLKLNWKDSTQTLDEFVGSVNEGNSFELDSDFVVRSLLAVSDLGTRFDVNLLRNQSSVSRVKENFTGCCDAIRRTVEFVQNDCWIESGRLLKDNNNLIPFVYYFFHLPDYEAPTGEVTRMRKAIYLLGFSHPFSRHSDRRLGRLIHEVLKPALEKGDKFPLEESSRWVGGLEETGKSGAELLQGNPTLALHLLRQGGSNTKPYENGVPKIDYVFPRPGLRKMGYDRTEINHFANFWILSGGKSPNKGGKNPAEYFGDVNDTELNKALIDRGLLDYNRYKTFLKEREGKILAGVKKKLKLSDSDFNI